MPSRRIDWTRLSAVAEIVSAVAILVTLLYLAQQTDLNTRVMLSTAQQGLVEREMDMLNIVVANPDIILLFDKPALEPLERAKLMAYLTTLVRSRESIFRQYRLGVVDEGTYVSAEAVLVTLLQSERIHNFWTNTEDGLDSEFVRRVNAQFSLRSPSDALPGSSFLEQIFGAPVADD